MLTITRHSCQGRDRQKTRPCSILIESKLGPNLLFYRDFQAVKCSISLEITLALRLDKHVRAALPPRQLLGLGQMGAANADFCAAFQAGNPYPAAIVAQAADPVAADKVGSVQADELAGVEPLGKAGDGLVQQIACALMLALRVARSEEH